MGLKLPTVLANALPSQDLPSMFRRPDQVASPLYVVTPLFNPVRFRSRWRLYRDFEKMCADAGAILYTVEIAFGDRDFVTDPNNPRHVQLRTSHEMWFKENAINIGVQHLPPDWQHVAWIDADTRFVRDDWANEAVHRLQHYDVIQMWSQYQDLTSDYELVGTAPGFVHNCMTVSIENLHIWISCKCHCKPCTCRPCYPYAKPRPGQKGYPGAPGLAWACTRKAWNTFGGLLDTCILGAGDWYMAHGLYGLVNERMVNRNNHQRYRDTIFNWQERALRLRKNVGVMPGLALHYWHGPKVHRKYGTREQILIETQYNPESHLSRDWQGLWQFTEAAPPELRDRVRNYFAQRNEDIP
jgi:hypothetical protein